MTRDRYIFTPTRWLALVVIAMGVLLVTHDLRGQGREAGNVDKALAVTFTTVPVYVDSGDVSLAAYQFELTETRGRMTVVGIENGEHPAFAQPPYYDAEALAAGDADRVVVAAFSLNKRDQLPAGQTRVATVQVRLQGPGEPDYQLKLITAGDVQGNPIADAAISMTKDADE